MMLTGMKPLGHGLIVGAFAVAALLGLSRSSAADWFQRIVLLLAGWLALCGLAYVVAIRVAPAMSGEHPVMPVGQVLFAAAASIVVSALLFGFYVRRGLARPSLERWVVRLLAAAFLAIAVCKDFLR